MFMAYGQASGVPVAYCVNSREFAQGGAGSVGGNYRVTRASEKLPCYGSDTSMMLLHTHVCARKNYSALGAVSPVIRPLGRAMLAHGVRWRDSGSIAAATPIAYTAALRAL